MCALISGLVYLSKFGFVTGSRTPRHADAEPRRAIYVRIYCNIPADARDRIRLTGVGATSEEKKCMVMYSRKCNSAAHTCDALTGALRKEKRESTGRYRV